MNLPSRRSGNLSETIAPGKDLDKTGLKNAEPEIFSSVAEFLNSLLPLTSFHCIRNFIFWAGDVNIKNQSENRRKRLHFFATPNNSTFAFGFCCAITHLQLLPYSK